MPLIIEGNNDVIIGGKLFVVGGIEQESINSTNVGINMASRGTFTRLESLSNLLHLGTGEGDGTIKNLYISNEGPPRSIIKFKQVSVYNENTILIKANYTIYTFDEILAFKDTHKLYDIVLYGNVLTNINKGIEISKIENIGNGEYIIEFLNTISSNSIPLDEYFDVFIVNKDNMDISENKNYQNNILIGDGYNNYSNNNINVLNDNLIMGYNSTPLNNVNLNISNNILLGKNTSKQLINGIHNTIVGNRMDISTYHNNPTNNENTYIGYNSGTGYIGNKNIVTGYFNNHPGYPNINAKHYCDGDIYIGYNCGSDKGLLTPPAVNDTISSGNIVIGYDAGKKYSNSRNNICIGYKSGSTVSSNNDGSNNIIIGSSAGKNSLTNENNCIYIGPSAGPKLNESKDNVLIIDIPSKNAIQIGGRGSDSLIYAEALDNGNMELIINATLKIPVGSINCDIGSDTPMKGYFNKIIMEGYGNNDLSHQIIMKQTYYNNL